LSIRKSQAFFADFQYVGMGATLVYGSDVWSRS
jgi:hypothetical protein